VNSNGSHVDLLLNSIVSREQDMIKQTICQAKDEGSEHMKKSRRHDIITGERMNVILLDQQGIAK
jgi:hypothetical protein